MATPLTGKRAALRGWDILGPVRLDAHCDGDGRFFDPHGMAVDDAWRVYVADAGNNRVQMFISTGEFLDTWS